MRPYDIHNRSAGALFDFLAPIERQHVSTQIAGHDDDGIAEIDLICIIGGIDSTTLSNEICEKKKCRMELTFRPLLSVK